MAWNHFAAKSETLRLCNFLGFGTGYSVSYLYESVICLGKTGPCIHVLYLVSLLWWYGSNGTVVKSSSPLESLAKPLGYPSAADFVVELLCSQNTLVVKCISGGVTNCDNEDLLLTFGTACS